MQTSTRRQGWPAPESGVSAIRPQPSLAVAKALLEAAQLPTADLTEAHCQHFFFWGEASAPVGLVGLELFGEHALLRSLAVNPLARSAGVGSALVRHAEIHARAQGVRALYLLTTTAEPLFLRLGYSNLPRDAAPQAIRNSAEFAGICPASSAFMSKQL
jgi:amino-acid N-acetyltransferase